MVSAVDTLVFFLTVIIQIVPSVPAKVISLNSSSRQSNPFPIPTSSRSSDLAVTQTSAFFSTFTSRHTRPQMRTNSGASRPHYSLPPFTSVATDWAFRLASSLFPLFGVSQDVKDLSHADSLEDQTRIWLEKLRHVLLNPLVVVFLKSPISCWNALGMPMNQRKMLLDDGSM